MKFQKEDILKAFEVTKVGAAVNHPIAQMENAMFTGEDLITYNDQICVLCPFETDFDASVNFKDLKNIISKIPEDEIEITKEGNELRITSKSTNAGLPLTLEDEISENISTIYDQLPHEENDLEWQKLPEEFMKGALLCIPAASNDQSLGTLTCLYANNQDLFCSDNQRVSWYQLKKSLNSEFFIKASTVRELSHFEFDEFCVAESWIHFQTENKTIFSTRMIKGKSIEVFKKLFTDFKGGAVVELPENMKEAVDSASVMSEDDQQRDMDIKFNKGELICSTRSARGWIERKMKMQYKSNEPLEFRISASYLQQILHLPLKMTVGDNKSLFQYENFKHILIHKIG